MTGICGFRALEPQAESSAGLCERMQRSLKMYGPDRSGLWNGGDVALGVQLARLLPEDRYDRQPLAGAGVRILADVRLDNRPELAVELGLSSERTAVMADADYVLAAWERWGVDCLPRLYGDYALAVWDEGANVLHLARDPLGRRPLFLHQGPGFIAFASMVKGLHALPEVTRAPDLQTLEDYLALAPMRGPRSFFADIERVEPGQRLEIGADGVIARSFWYDWSVDRGPRLATEAAYIEAFRTTFDRAVAERLRTNGTVASHLSSGFDSSAVTATAALQLAERGRRLTAYTHVPTPGLEWHDRRNRHADEGPLAAVLAADHANIDHVKVDSGERMIGDDLDATVFAAEFPMLNLCNQVWMSEVERRLRAARTAVLLTGELGNMTISQEGMERLPELLAQGRLISWTREVWALRRRGFTLRNVVVARSLGALLPPGFTNALRRLRGEPELNFAAFSALRSDIVAGEGFQKRMAALGYDPQFRPWANPRNMAEFVIRRLDVGALRSKAVLAQYGVDVRDPTADRRLIELCLSLPRSLLLRGGRTRWIYHRAFANRVPEAIRTSTSKGFQGADWLDRLKRSEGVLSPLLNQFAENDSVRGLMDWEAVNAANAQTKRATSTEAALINYRQKLLRGVSVGHFAVRTSPSNH